MTCNNSWIERANRTVLEGRSLLLHAGGPMQCDTLFGTKWCRKDTQGNSLVYSLWEVFAKELLPLACL
eukprot:12931376-Prorocentrum_lima.AAC.1